MAAPVRRNSRLHIQPFGVEELQMGTSVLYNPKESVHYDNQNALAAT